MKLNKVSFLNSSLYITTVNLKILNLKSFDKNLLIIFFNPKMTQNTCEEAEIMCFISYE
jgi:hypothetical protein